MSARILLALVLLLSAFAVQAEDAVVVDTIDTVDTENLYFTSPEREALYRKMVLELRCLVCQNQNIADSNAELAQDLRRRTYDLVSQGKSEQDIVAFMVQRYGDFVMYRPPFKSTTLFLWLGPFLILVLAVAMLLLYVRRRDTQAARAPDIAPADLDQARKLLEKNTS